MKWKIVVGYPNYAVSNTGLVKRINSHTSGKAGHILKISKGSCNYPQVSLHSNGKQKSFRIYQLVAPAFLGVRPNGYDVNHKDGNKWNSHASNLEYITPEQNKEHARRKGLYAWGERNSQCVIPSKTILNMRKWFKAGVPVIIIARGLGLGYWTVWNIVHNRHRIRDLQFSNKYSVKHYFKQRKINGAQSPTQPVKVEIKG